MINKFPIDIEKCDTFNLPYVTIDNHFTNEDLDKIISYCETKGLTDAKIGGQDFGIVNKQIRNTKLGIIQADNENDWIFKKLNSGITKLNDQHYKYDLLGFEYFTYLEYEPNGHYVFHIDYHLHENVHKKDPLPRKLSVSLILNDETEYTGGNLEFFVGSTITVKQPKGRLIGFPSWMVHRVSPVKSGKRKALVVWILGSRVK